MNRIAVANDRITQIFGDEGTFESQNDENTGQVFLKPTAENGPKSLSITLITEQGITQDLTLKPTAKSATTLILKNNAAGVAHKTGERSNQSTHEPSFTQSEGNSIGFRLLCIIVFRKKPNPSRSSPCSCSSKLLQNNYPYKKREFLMIMIFLDLHQMA